DTSRSTCPASETSPCSGSAAPPRARTEAAVSSAASRSEPATKATAAPSRASASATARPMPRLPPVTSATWGEAPSTFDGAVLATTSTRPGQDRRGPGKPGAEADQRQRVAGPESPLRQRLDHRDRHGGGRGVAVPVDIVENPLSRQLEPPGCGVQDANVRLM